MTNEKMVEMMEFFEVYEMFKAMKSKQTVSARTESVITSKNDVTTYFENANLIQRGDEVVNLGKTPSRDVPTKYTIEKCGNSFRIKHNIATRGKKYIDKKTGEEKRYRFNKVAVMLANNAIKALNEHPDFKGELLEFKIPFDDGSGKSFKGWGFKTKKQCEKALEVLPEVIKASEIDKVKEAK